MIDPRFAEADLFSRLRRTNGFEQWLQERLDEQIKTLMVNPDPQAVRFAQGTAQAYRAMLDKLSAARGSVV